MAADSPPETTAAHRDDAGRFVAGNPGRPRGSKHAALVALDAIGQDGAEDVLNAVIEAAKAGDIRAEIMATIAPLPDAQSSASP